jgi:Sulfotransferase family
MSTVDAGGKNLVFIVGSPRSGTSWLSRLMGAHDAIAAPQETELLNRYCRSWYDVWNDQLPADADRWQRHRHRGLPAVMTTEEFDECVVGFARDVYAKILALKPTARVVVDKNPQYSLDTDLIRQMFPDAAVLHIVRDGRDVAASMLAASRGWGRDWAPSQVRLAARTWRTNVESALSAASSGRYLQVRYEDLLADGAHVLAECLTFAGVSTTPEECAGIAARFDRRTTATERGDDSLVWAGEVVNRLGAAPAEPEGFFGSRSTTDWREAWMAGDRLDFDLEAGQLLRSLGYATSNDWLAVTTTRRRRAAAMRRMAERSARLGWWLHMLLGRRGLYVHVARVSPYSKST